MITLVPSDNKNFFILTNPLLVKLVQQEKYMAVPADEVPSLMLYGWKVFALGVGLTFLSAFLVATGPVPTVGSISMGLSTVISSAMVIAISIKAMSYKTMKLKPDFSPASSIKILSFRAVFAFCFFALASGVLLAVI